MSVPRRNPYSTYRIEPNGTQRLYDYLVQDSSSPTGWVMYTSPESQIPTRLRKQDLKVNSFIGNAGDISSGQAIVSRGSNPLTVVDNVLDDTIEAGVNASRTGGLKNPGSLKDFFTKNFAWNKGSGLQAFGKNVGKFSNIAGGVIQGVQAGIGAGKLGKTRKGIDNTVDDILTAYARNPLAVTYLTEDQKNTLRSLKNGSYGKGASFGDYMPNSVGDVVRPMIGAGLGFLTGGVPGAIINGVGGHVNEGITNANESQQEKLNELSALYEVLQQAELEQQMLQRANAQRTMYNMYM